ncbi:MAG TPA: peptidylprolyl isomerase [Gammaproteobacteria bacterium]|nr:peptidylprolyl isomerase [Gammaproteobacteria bacterium]
MKRIIFLLVFFIFYSINSFAKPAEQPLDNVVAIVNEDVITRSELNHDLDIVKIQIAREQIPAPANDILQKQVLDQMINKTLQLQLAKQGGIEVNDTDLDKAVLEIAERNQIPVKLLYQRIQEEGMLMADYRKEMHDRLIMQKLQQQEVSPHISVSSQEITHFINSRVWQNNSAKEYRLEDILIPVSDTPSTEEIMKAKKHALGVLGQLNQGKSFREIAQVESGDSHALRGGDLGWRKLPEIPSAFATEILKMQINDIAGPIQTPNGFHIIRLAAVRALGGKQEIPSRRQIEQLLLQRKFEEAVQNWISKLRNQAFIVINV